MLHILLDWLKRRQFDCLDVNLLGWARVSTIKKNKLFNKVLLLLRRISFLIRYYMYHAQLSTIGCVAVFTIVHLHREKAY